ncbi:DUF6011 domain-containing protein [Streptomyces sp. NPDC005322]|uniref:DUF6011 domain-containing protein n=1 Tax=unclassified Streptomyces TaxID=2593676 RepID=UPI0033B74704
MASTTTHPHCLRCGHTLTSPRSTRTGYGPTCAAKVRAAAKTADLADYKPAQLDSARQLIEDGAIIRIRPTVFRAVSSDGIETYLAHPTNRTCPGGIKGRRCYHTAAARMLLAA